MKQSPPLPWTVTVNGQPLGVPEELADGYTGQTQFDVAPGEKVTIEMTVTVPAHTQMTKFFLGITGDTSGIGPRGPIGMEPVLATASNLTPGVHAFTVHWTAPAGAAPRYGYRIAMATFWPRSVKSEPNPAEIPLVGVAVRPGSPVTGAAAVRLRTLALQAAKKDGDAKPQWIVAVRTTFAQAMAAADPGGSVPGVGPGTRSTWCWPRAASPRRATRLGPPGRLPVGRHRRQDLLQLRRAPVRAGTSGSAEHPGSAGGPDRRPVSPAAVSLPQRTVPAWDTRLFPSEDTETLVLRALLFAQKVPSAARRTGLS